MLAHHPKMAPPPMPQLQLTMRKLAVLLVELIVGQGTRMGVPILRMIGVVGRVGRSENGVVVAQMKVVRSSGILSSWILHPEVAGGRS
jgi:hypothetical protein